MKILNIGTTGDYKPFSFYDPETQKYEGFDIEIINSVFALSGYTINFIKTSWTTFMDDLKSNRFDVMVAVFLPQKREN